VADLGRLVQDAKVVDAVRAHAPLGDIMTIAADGVAAWRDKREKYLLYPSVPCAPAAGTDRASPAATKEEP
jgi:hypothetical protein